MKKRWGKPITQVQRFVPQYCISPCDKGDGKVYKLKGPGKGSSSDHGSYNNLYVDYNNKITNGKYDGNPEKNYFSTSDYGYATFTENQINTWTVPAVYQGPATAPSIGTEYTAINGFILYTSETICYYGNKYYVAERTSS